MELLQPFEYEFFVRGMIIAMITGAINGILGVYVILRGMSYIGHGLSHAVFGGAVVSIMMNINIYIGATIWGIASSIIIDWVSKRGRIRADAIIGMISTTGFAIGIFLISTNNILIRNLEALLFGNIIGVTEMDMYIIIIISIIASIFFFLSNKMMLFAIFDRDTARVYGIRTDLIEFVFSIILSVVIIASMYVIGVTLLAAAIIAPAITARLLTNNFLKMIMLSLLIGSLTAFVGMYLSFILNSSSGATIVLSATSILAIASLYRVKRSIRLPL